MHKTLLTLLTILGVVITCDPTLETVTSYLLYINEVEYEVLPKPDGCVGVKIEEDVEGWLQVGENVVYARARNSYGDSDKSNEVFVSCSQGCEGLLCEKQ